VSEHSGTVVEAGEHAANEGAHAPFSIQAAMLHHNAIFPAWEPAAGHPWLIFDLGTYAAIELPHLRHETSFASADGAPYLDWAREVVARGDFRYEHGLDAGDVAKAMAVAAHEAPALPKSLSWINNQIFFGGIAFSLLFLVVGVLFRRRRDQLKPEGRIQGAIEGLVVYLRDEIVRPAFHGHDRPWTPFFVSMFLMILSANLFGLIPGTGTLTANIGVTAGFALITLVCMLFFGMKAQGLAFWPNLVPIHFSWGMSPIWFLLLIIELLGLAIRPFALAVRLFANMFAGHTVMLVFLSLGYVIISQSHDSVGLASSLGVFGFILAIAFHAMEVLVAFVQAYVFTMLSAMFIGMSIHPEH
jgi:F-type H+-transporting ATPase subunit a